jgi:hypothetical protein
MKDSHFQTRSVASSLEELEAEVIQTAEEKATQRKKFSEADKRCKYRAWRHPYWDT